MASFPDTGHCALRRGRVSIPERSYLLTVVTHRRRCLFLDPLQARIASRIIHSDASWGDANLLAWVLMPDHWHGLVQLGDESLFRVVSRFKAHVTRALHASCAIEGAVWERSFHDHALRIDEGVRQAARYIVANPIRAGLATNALDYPYWNAIWLGPDDAS